jgi:hypothetical protein
LRFRVPEGAKVEFAATDVGDSAAGAEISVQGKTLTADAHGPAFMTFPKGTKPGAIAAQASMKDYSSDSVRVTATAK